MPFPFIPIIAGAFVVSGVLSVSDLIKNTSDAIENAGNAAKKSESFLDRVIILSVIGGALYISSITIGVVE